MSVCEYGFRCALCGADFPPDDGCWDCIERVLGDEEYGVCGSCFSRLPDHVIEWAEQFEERARAQ